MADMHDAATAEAASLYEFEHGNVTRVRFDAQALAPVLTGNRLGGLQQIATKTLPAMTLGNRNTMQHGISRVARVGRRQPCALDGIVNRFAGEADDGGGDHFAVFLKHIGVTGFALSLNFLPNWICGEIR